MSVIQKVFEGNRAITSEDILQLNGMLFDHYKKSPNVISIPKENVLFVGDLHGELTSLLKIKDIFLKSHSYLVFLGDYADRGPAQIETINLVSSLVLKFPDRVTMLRGNHESESVASIYGFRDVIKANYSDDIFHSYCDMFSVLPLAGSNPSSVFACHGGVPRSVQSLKQIKDIDRFNREFIDSTAFQLMWNDPAEGEFYFNPNPRGGKSLVFGELAFNEFMDSLNYRLMIRAHEVYQDGVKLFFNGRLVSVFSASYMGRVTPKIVHLDKNLKVQQVKI